MSKINGMEYAAAALNGDRLYKRGKHLIILTVFFLFASAARSQQGSFGEELRFARYLLDKNLYKEAIYVLTAIDTTRATPSQKDSLFYATGWAAYEAKSLDTALLFFNRITPTAPSFRKGRAFAGYTNAYLHSYAPADSIFQALHTSDSLENELYYFERAGISLLKRDYTNYELLRPHFSYSSYILQQEEQRMEGYYSKLKSYHHKSPFLAGFYSALLPGAGKWYAGKKKQGIAAFMPIASLGLLAWEGYRKGGFKSARFIGFGALFSVFYIGNIWGSSLAVKVKEKEFNREYENKILFDMHIPLRNFYR